MRRNYFEEPEELPVDPLLEPMPVLPAPGVVLLGELELSLGELELLLGALVPPLEELELCSLRQRSFSEPVRLSH